MKQEYSTFFRILLLTMSSIFAAEVGVMYFISVVRPTSGTAEVFLDGLLTSIIIFPILYFTLFRKILLENRERREGEEKMRRANEELKAMQNQLVQAEKLFALSKLADGAAHEILNPLNIITFQVQLMEMEEDLEEEQRRAYSSISEQVRRITKVTNGLRVFSSQHESGEKLDIDINQLLDVQLGLVGPDLKLHNIKVEREFSPRLTTIEADREQIEQVFVNIIMNARDAMLQGGTLRIRTMKQEEKGRSYNVVEFSDTGLGIPDGCIQKIFDPFFTTKPANEGTGLGLSICYGIIERMNGKLYARSKMGEGSTFVVEFPA